MPQVTFLPLQRTVDADLNETVLDVALRHGIPMQHACGGFCACTTCHLYVIQGTPDAVSPPEEAELDRIEGVLGLKTSSRLGCQTQVRGDLTVELVNPTD